MELKNLELVIDEIVKESLSDKVYIYGKKGSSLTNRVASGRLRDSVKSQIKPLKGGAFLIVFTAFGKLLDETYAYWLINDRKPGPSIGSQKGRKKTGNYNPGPFVSAIEEWIQNKKSFKLRNYKTGKFIEKNKKNIRSAAWVIARSIAKNGFKNQPKNFLQISLEKINSDPRVLEIIGDAAFEDILNEIDDL